MAVNTKKRQYQVLLLPMSDVVVGFGILLFCGIVQGTWYLYHGTVAQTSGHSQLTSHCLQTATCKLHRIICSAFRLEVRSVAFCPGRFRCFFC